MFFQPRQIFVGKSNAEPLPKLNRFQNRIAPKVCVEHTSVNPNKAAHIGHVATRFWAIRSCEFCGRTASASKFRIILITPAFRSPMSSSVHLSRKNESGRHKKTRRKIAAEGKTFDYYCWDLYARVGQAYQNDEELKAKRAESSAFNRRRK
jgi:arginyl-tRNA synthetase